MKSRNTFNFILFYINKLCIYYVLDTMFGVGYVEINDFACVRLYVVFTIYKWSNCVHSNYRRINCIQYYSQHKYKIEFASCSNRGSYTSIIKLPQIIFRMACDSNTTSSILRIQKREMLPVKTSKNNNSSFILKDRFVHSETSKGLSSSFRTSGIFSQ